MPRHGARLRAAVAWCTLLAVWLLVPGGEPLFDGIGFPDEPYRYVVAPDGAGTTARPTVAIASVRLRGGTNASPITLSSKEVGPQVAVQIAAGALQATGAAHQVTVTATPVTPDGRPPRGTWDGNAYRVAIADDAGTGVTPVVGVHGLGTVTLRATVPPPPSAKAVYRSTAAASWRLVPAALVGQDVYQCGFLGPGDYALVLGAGGDTGTALPVLLATVPLILVAFGSIAVLVRRRRTGAVERQPGATAHRGRPPS